VPIDSSQVDGRVRRDCVEGHASGELLVRVEVLVPATPLDPGAGWDLGEDVPDTVRTVVGGAAVAKIDPDHREPEADQVPVSVCQTLHDHLRGLGLAVVDPVDP